MLHDHFDRNPRAIWDTSDEVIKWAAGISDNADKIRKAVIQANHIDFELCHPLLYVIGDRQLDPAKIVLDACQEWIDEM